MISKTTLTTLALHSKTMDLIHTYSNGLLTLKTGTYFLKMLFHLVMSLSLMSALLTESIMKTELSFAL